MKLSVSSTGEEIDIYTDAAALRELADKLEQDGSTQVTAQYVDVEDATVLVTFEAGDF